MKIPALILSATLSICFTASGQSNQHQVNQGPDGAPQVSQKDKLFLHAIASEDQSEIDLAKLALQKTTNAQIQQYAKSKILAADPDMEKDAMQVAQQNHATISSKPNAAAQRQYQIFKTLSENEFDKAYSRYEDRMQAADLKVVTREAGAAINPQVRSYAQKEVTPVKLAADAARQLAQAMNVSKTS